jgi:hypothetical protein
MVTSCVPSSKCICGYEVDAATSLYGHYAPKPGALTICLNCACLHRFDEQMQLQPVTREEFAQFSEDVRDAIWRARKPILEGMPS